jgi:hypothetical protein
MIQLAQKNNISLIFVRTKTYGPEPQALSEYTKDLDAYLSDQNHVFLIDFIHDPRIKVEYYKDSLHMNSYGKQEFTKILAGEFTQIVRK